MDTDKTANWMAMKLPTYNTIALLNGYTLRPMESFDPPPTVTYSEAKRLALTLLPQVGERVMDRRCGTTHIGTVTAVRPGLHRSLDHMVVDVMFDETHPDHPSTSGIRYSIDAWWDGLLNGGIKMLCK